jgi:hypothetical protein
LTLFRPAECDCPLLNSSNHCFNPLQAGGQANAT